MFIGFFKVPDPVMFVNPLLALTKGVQPASMLVRNGRYERIARTNRILNQRVALLDSTTTTLFMICLVARGATWCAKLKLHVLLRQTRVGQIVIKGNVPGVHVLFCLLPMVDAFV